MDLFGACIADATATPAEELAQALEHRDLARVVAAIEKLPDEELPMALANAGFKVFLGCKRKELIRLMEPQILRSCKHD